MDVRGGLRSDLLRGREDEAADVLARVFAPDSLAGSALLDGFNPSGTRADAADRFTADDVVAVSLVTAGVPGAAAHRLLVAEGERLSGLLAWLGPDRDLVAEASTDPHHLAPAWELARALRALPGVDARLVSVLLARKRPRLLPILDAPLNRHPLGGTGVLWATVHHALQADGCVLFHRLLDVRQRAGLSPSVSPLRLLDVLTHLG